MRKRFDRRIVWANRRDSPTPAWLATPSAFAACAGRATSRPHNESSTDRMNRNALSYLGLLRLLPDCLSRLSSCSQEQPADEHLVDVGLLHLLRLVESVVFTASLCHIRHCLRHGPAHGAEP